MNDLIKRDGANVPAPLNKADLVARDATDSLRDTAGSSEHSDFKDSHDNTSRTARVAKKRSPRFMLPWAGFERMIGFRYLRSSSDGYVSVITIISFLGIGLGVATLIVVLAVLNGFRFEVRNKILGINGHVLIQFSGGRIENPEDLAGRLAEVEGAQSVRFYTETTVLVSSRRNASGGLMRGIDPQSLSSESLLSDLLSAEDIEVLREGKSVLLGESLALLLGVNAGDSIDIVVPNGFKGPFGTVPRLRSYVVGGTFQVGFSDFDRSLVLINLEQARDLLSLGTAANAMEVLLESPDEASQFIAKIKDKYPEETKYSISWQERNSTFFGALRTERNVMFLVLMLIILIASLNVVSGMVMLVKEKTREIAVLRTIGVSRMAVARIFFLTGGVIAISGTFGGLLLGLAICAKIQDIQSWLEKMIDGSVFPSEVYYLSNLPARVDPVETAVVVVSALVLTVITALFPAIRAARLDPVEALRDG